MFTRVLVSPVLNRDSQPFFEAPEDAGLIIEQWLRDGRKADGKARERHDNQWSDRLKAV
jgi:hypothetical protein